MELNQLCDSFKSGEISKDDFIKELSKMRAFTKSDRFKLKVVDNAPFSMWACDENHIICYWECECERIYGYPAEEAIGQRFLELFVAPAERNQAEFECTKIIEGRSVPGEFINNIAVDFDSLGRDVTLMTNCFRIYDEESQKWLQAEIALPTDIKKVVQKHANILRNYQKLNSMILQSSNDSTSFLESISSRVSRLTAETRRINRTRKKELLPAEDLSKLSNLQSDIEDTLRRIFELIKDKQKIVKDAKSIELYKAASYEYTECKNQCVQMLDDVQDYLDDIVEELRIQSIADAAELNQAKNRAISDCDAKSSTLLSRINKMTEAAYDALDSLSFDGATDDIPRQRIGQYTSYTSEVMNKLTEVKAHIDRSATKAQIQECISSFECFLDTIEKKLNREG